MALVENHGAASRKTEQRMKSDKRVRVVVDARAVNSHFHGAKLREGENELTIPESLLHEIEAKVEDADWGPVLDRFEKKIYELTHNIQGEKIREPEQVTYNVSQAFVEHYMREPRKFRSMRVVERDLDPPMSDADKMAVTLVSKLTSAQSSGRKVRRASADGST